MNQQAAGGGVGGKAGAQAHSCERGRAGGGGNRQGREGCAAAAAATMEAWKPLLSEAGFTDDCGRAATMNCELQLDFDESG